MSAAQHETRNRRALHDCTPPCRLAGSEAVAAIAPTLQRGSDAVPSRGDAARGQRQSQWWCEYARRWCAACVASRPLVAAPWLCVSVRSPLATRRRDLAALFFSAKASLSPGESHSLDHDTEGERTQQQRHAEPPAVLRSRTTVPSDQRATALLCSSSRADSLHVALMSGNDVSAGSSVAIPVRARRDSAPGARIQPQAVFGTSKPNDSRGRSSSNAVATAGSLIIAPTTRDTRSPSVAASPGNPEHWEPANSIKLKAVNTATTTASAMTGRLQQIETTTAPLEPIETIAVRKSTLPGGAARRKMTGSVGGPSSGSLVLARIALPSLAVQLHFHRRLWLLVQAITIAFFLTPIIGYIVLKTWRGSDWPVPPSTFHHTRRDGQFFPVSVRWGIVGYGAAYLIYAVIICVASLRRSKFFPFKSRPMLLVFCSNVWGLLILVWCWSRYLSDWASAEGDGLLPPCWLSQTMLCLAQVGLIFPFILRAFQLAMIFNRDDFGGGTAGADAAQAAGETKKQAPTKTQPIKRNQQQMARKVSTSGIHSSASRSLNGAVAPPSPHSQHSLMDEPHGNHMLNSAHSTPRLAPQAAPPTRSPNQSPARHRSTPSSGGAYAHVISAGSLVAPPGQSVPRGPAPPFPSGTTNLPPARHARVGMNSSVDPSPLLSPVSPSPYLSNSPEVDEDTMSPTPGGPETLSSPPGPRRKHRGGCLDNLTDRRLTGIYLLLLLPFLGLSIATVFVPSMSFLSNFYCTDHGPASEEARWIWTVFGGVEVGAFLLGMWSTRGVWDGFEIRRELIIGVGSQTGIILLTLVSIFTGRYTDMFSAANQTCNSLMELLVWVRSLLLFHVSLALPLVESYDLNALPVGKARVMVHGRSESEGGDGNEVDVSFDQDEEDDDGKSRSGSMSQSLITHDTAPTRFVLSRPKPPYAPPAMDPILDTSLSLSLSQSGAANLTPGYLHALAYKLGNLGTKQEAHAADDKGFIGSYIDSSPSAPTGAPATPGASDGPIPLTLGYIISHVDWSDYFVDFVSRDPQMALLWQFYCSIVLFQDQAGADDATPAGDQRTATSAANQSSRRASASKLFNQFFDESTLRGSSDFSQWLLLMANVIAQDDAGYGAAMRGGGAASAAGGQLAPMQATSALIKADEEINRIAGIIFAEPTASPAPAVPASSRRNSAAPLHPFDLAAVGSPSSPVPGDIPRSLFDRWQSAAFEIMSVWFYPKFLRSRFYKAMLREIRKTNSIQYRLDRAHQ